MNLLEIGWGGVHWIGLAQYKDKWRVVVNAVMNLGVPQNAENFSSGCTTSGLLCRVSMLLHIAVLIMVLCAIYC
jgi:hypothetical protein